jgi:Fe-S-cluster containining protein
VKFFWLNFQLPYQCRHSGMCCSSGWPIPVEQSRVAAIDETVARDVIPLRAVPWLVSTPNLPDDVAGTLALRDNAHCVFFEAGKPGCAIHDVKPASCAHFPFVCLFDGRGVHVALSHYCPTSTSLLFEHSGPIEIVEGPSPIPALDMIEGLDAREALPPLYPGSREQLMSFEELTAWERDRVARATIEELQDDDVALFDRARAAVPSPLSWPEAPARIESIFFSMVAPSWPKFADVLTRYAAAKAFASWSLYLGDGVEPPLRPPASLTRSYASNARDNAGPSAARSIASCYPTRSSRATFYSCTTPIPNASLQAPGRRPGQTTLPSEAQPRYFEGSSAGLT